MLSQIAFELGQVLLKVELSKSATADDLRTRGGSGAERVVLQKIGKFWNQENWLDRPDGLVVVTNYRLAFLSKVKSITVETDFLSFPFDQMADVRTARIMWVSPAIRFEVAGRPYVFTFFSGAADVKAAIDAARR